MMNIKVLGSGCSKCEVTANLIEKAAQAKGVKISLEKVTDMAAILSYGVMSTPGVVVDGRVVHSGSVPSSAAVDLWLSNPGECCGCCGGKG